MKNSNKFLSLALLFSISFNQVSLCMQKKEEIIEIEEKQITKKNNNLEEINSLLKENTEKLRSFELDTDAKEKRDKSLGAFSKLPNEILFNIFSFTNMKTMKDLLSSSKSNILQNIFFESPKNKTFAKVLKKIEKIKNDPITHPKLIILHGLTKTGKNFTARTLTKNIFNVNRCINIIGTNLLSPYLGGSEKNIQKIIDDANKLNDKFSVIIINEFDYIAQDKEIITYIQSILSEDKCKNIILILTTTNINYIPNEITSRADLILEINRQLSEQISNFYEPEKIENTQNKGIFALLKYIFCSYFNK